MMKSEARRAKRLEARRQQLLHEIESRKRIWNAAIAGDAEACRYLSMQYWGMKDEPESDHRAVIHL